MSETLWQIEYEETCEWFLCGILDEEEFFNSMRSLGFDDVEIDNHLTEMGE